MIKPWHLAPMLAIVALTTSAYWWKDGKGAWNPPPARVPELPQAEAMPGPAPLKATHALERPLLWSSRRVVESGDKKSGMAQELMQSRLMAVFESGQERVAVLQRKDGATMKITAETSPWRLESFDGRKARFVSSDAQQVERPLEAGSSVPAKGQPRLAQPLGNQAPQ